MLAAHALLCYDVAEGTEDVDEAAGLLVALCAVVHDVDGVGDVCICCVNAVEARELVGEDDKRAGEEEVDYGWVAA